MCIFLNTNSSLSIAHLQGVVPNYLGSIYQFDLFTLVQFSTVQQSLSVLLA